jgi:hypothetical protein
MFMAAVVHRADVTELAWGNSVTAADEDDDDFNVDNYVTGFYAECRW